MHHHTILSETFMRMPHGYLNLDTAAQAWAVNRFWKGKETLSFADPDVAHAMEEETHAQLGLSWSYGGWLEDRSAIRRGTYLDEKQLYLHTGVDVNVNPGTPVYFPTRGTVVHVGDDTKTFGKGGWGVHIIQRIDEGPLIGKGVFYAHLAPTDVRRGGVFNQGDLIGLVGDKGTNGYWRPHLHVQLVTLPTDYREWTARAWESFSDVVDGYAPLTSKAESARAYPDPTALIFGAYAR